MSTKFNIYEYLKSNPRNLYLSDEEINFMRSAGYSDEEMDEAADPEAKQRSQEQFIRAVGGIPQTLMQGLVDLTHTMYDATAETVIAGVDPVSGMAITQDTRITQEQKEKQLAASKEQSQESVDYLQKEILQGLYSSVMGDQNVEMVERNGNFVAAIKKPEGTILNLTRGIGTFAAEFAGLNKLLGPAKAKSRLGKITDYALRGEAVAQVAINPYEENLANILGSYIANLNVSDREGILADINNLLYSYREPLQKTLPTLEKFYYEKGDSSLEARSKLLFEGLVLTLGIESVVGLGLVSARGLRTIKKDAKAYSELPYTDVKPKKKEKEKSYYIDEKGTKVEFDMPTAGETIKQLSKETLEDLKNGFIGILKNISKDETKIDDFVTALTNSFKISKKEKGSSLYETIKKRRIEEIEAGNVKGYGDLDAVKNLFGLVKSRYQGNNNSVINWLGKTRDYIFSTKASGMPDRLFRAFDVKEGKTAEWLKIIEFTARDFEAGLDDLFGYIGKGKPELLAKVNKIIDTDYRLSEEGKYLLGGRTTRRKNKYQQKKFLESLKELPEVLQEPVRKIRSITDRLTESAMKNAGLTKDELKDFREGLGSYMRVSYEAYENASFYPTRSAEQTLKSELREFYIRNFPKEATDPGTGEQFIKDKIAQDLDQILNRDGDTIRQLYKTIEGYKKTETITKERKLKDKTIKTFLGEIEDPLDRFLLSTVKVVRYVEDMKFYKQTYEDGLGIWLFDPTKKIIDSTKKTETSAVIPRGFNSVIPDNHGPLSGLHTSPEINRFIQGLNEGQVFATRDKGNKLWEFFADWIVRYGSYNSFLKYEATVGSFASAFKNFFGSGTMNTQQGINPFSKEYVEGISNVVHEFMRGTEKQKQEIILRIAKHNLLGKTVEIADIEGALYELGKIQRGRNSPERILESIFKQEISLPVPRLKNGSVDWIKADVSIKKIFDKGGEWYRGGDEAWKIGMFLHEAKHYKKIQDALPKNNPKAQKYIADPDEQAADIVKRSLQNYDRVSTFAKQLKSIPRFGQFYSFNQESVRIFVTTFKTLFEEGALWRNMKNDGFDEAAKLVRNRVLKRAVGFVSTNLAWSPKVTTAVLGYLYFKEGDEEDHQQKTIEAFKSIGPEWYKHANLVVIRNEKGQPVAVDLSSWNPEQYPIDFLMPWVIKALTVDPLKYNEAETMSDFVSEIVSKWADPWLGQDLASEVLAPFLTVNTEMQGQVINSVGNMVPVSAKQDSSWTYQKDINATWLDNFLSNFGLMMNNVLYQAAPRTVTQAIRFANDKTVAELEDVEYNEGLALLKIATGAGGLAGTEDFVTYGLNQKITTYKNIKSDLVQDLRRQIKTVKTTNDFKEKYLDVNLQLLEAQRELIKAFVGANFIAENFSDSDTERANLELRIAILDTLEESGLSKRDTVPITFAMYADTAYFEPIDLIAEAEDTTVMRMLETGGQQKEDVFDMYTDIVLELQQEMRQIPIYTELETIDYDRNYFEKTKEKIVEEGRQQKFQGGAISEKHHVPNVNLVPSERVDKNTGLPYEAEMERLGFKDGLLVSIGVAPVSEKQISKLKKSLKKRKAKANGGRIRLQGGSYSGDEQSYSLPVGTGASEDQRDPTEWQDYSARDPQMDPYRYGSQGADDYANWMDAQIARDEAYDYSEQRPDEGENGGIEPVIEASTSYQTNYDYFLPAWGSVVANAPNIFNRWLNKGRTGLIMSNTSQIAQNANGQYYIVPLYNTETGDKYESDEDMWNQVGSSIEDGTLAGYDSEEEAQIDRKKLYDTLIREHGLDSREDKDDTNQDDKERPKRKGGKTGGTVRDYDKEYANYHSSEKQKKDRAHRNNANRQLKRDGRIAAGDGNDVDHKDGNPRNNSPSNLLVKKKESNRSFSRKGYQRGGASHRGEAELIKWPVGKYTKNTYSPFHLASQYGDIEFEGIWSRGKENAEKILNMQEENIGRKKPYTDAEIESIANIARHIDIAGSSARKHPERDKPLKTLGPYGEIDTGDKRPSILNPNRVLLQGKEIVQAAFTGEGIKDSRQDWGNNKIGFNLGQQNLNATDEEWQEIIRDTINDSLQRRKQGLDHRKEVDVIF